MKRERARVAMAMTMAMRVAGNKEVKGSKGNGIGDEGGMQQRGKWQQRQKQWQQGQRESNSNY